MSPSPLNTAWNHRSPSLIKDQSHPASEPQPPGRTGLLASPLIGPPLIGLGQAILWSLIASAQRHEIDVQLYLRSVRASPASHAARRIAKLPARSVEAGFDGRAEIGDGDPSCQITRRGQKLNNAVRGTVTLCWMSKSGCHRWHFLSDSRIRRARWRGRIGIGLGWP
jgi:hypothetical protein